MDKNDLVEQIHQKAKVEGRTSLYNPLLQKPTSLYPVGPGSYPGGLGGYAYIGPPADFGGSFGCYEDAGGRKQIGVKSSKMFSMWDGTPMQLKGELSPEEREVLLTQLEDASEDHKCPHCRSELTISVTSAAEGPVHCPYCSSEMDGAAEKVKLCVSKLEEKKMEKQKDIVKQAAAVAQAAADLAKEAAKMESPQQHMGSSASDIAKEAMKVEPPKDGMQQPNLKPEASNLMDHSMKVKTEQPMKELEKSNASTDGAAPAAAAAPAAPVAPPAAPAIAAEDEEKAKKAKAEAEEKEKKAKAEAEEKEKKAKAEEDEKKAKASADADAQAKVEAARKERLKASIEKFKEKRKARAVAAAKAGKFDTATLAKLKRELRIMASLDPAKFAEVRKNEKLSAICADVEKVVIPKETRAQVRAELKALASDDAEAHEDAVKELEFVAPEILMEEDHKHAKSAEEEEMEKKAKAEAEEKAKGECMGAESEEEKAKKAQAEEEAKRMNVAPNPTPVMPSPAPAASAEEEEKKAKAEEDEWMKAMSMKTEFLASLKDLKGEKIEMSLYGEDSTNPFWNLTVDGEPVGRIHLQDQKDSDQIRASFVSDNYAENLGKAIDGVGLQKVLTLTNAKLFAHRLDDKEILARVRETAIVKAKTEMQDKISTLRKDFMRAVSHAIVASNKNFYQEENRHALKGGLFNALVQAGLTTEHAVWAIEAGFEEAPQYFDFVMDKAVEIMDMPKEARESLEKTIMSSGNLEVAEAKSPEEESLTDRLVRSSVSAIAMGGAANGENRSMIRSQMGLNPNRR